MRITDQFLDELKSRLSPSQVIGKRMQLKKQGREWAGLSPFSKEKTPSFFVNDDKGFYHCFSSGKHGDIISFLQETERLSFMEAVERLAADAGMQMPAPDPEAAQKQERAKGLHEALEAAAAFFQTELGRVRGQDASAYLKRREMPKAQIDKFRLGFAPDSTHALKDQLVQRGFTIPVLVEAGLLVKTDRGDVIDRFRNRLMFPITDHRDRVVAFGGRALDPNARAKYLNSPETPVFHKGRMVYNLAHARRLRGTTDPLVVVEGYMDVIACDQAGIAAVAPMGTAVTEDQIKLLWRVVDEPIMCFDGDGAGKRAATRAIERILPILSPGQSINFVWMPDGQDPDDLLKSQGAGALKAAFQSPDPLVNVLFRTEVEKTPTDTPERVAGAKSRLFAMIKSIEHTDVADAYGNMIRQKWDQQFGFQPAKRQGGDYRQKARFKGQVQRRPVARMKPIEGMLSNKFLNSLIARPALLDTDIEALMNLTLTQPEAQKQLDAVIQWGIRRIESDQALDKADLIPHLRSLGFHGFGDSPGTGGPDTILDFAADAVPMPEARHMMLQTLDRLTSVTAPSLPPGSGPKQTTAQGLASLASARAQAEARKASSGQKDD